MLNLIKTYSFQANGLLLIYEQNALCSTNMLFAAAIET